MVDKDVVSGGDDEGSKLDMKDVGGDGGDAELTVPPVESLSGAENGTGKEGSRTWQWSVVFLCFYGFMVQLKPGEPFITPFLLSPEKNFTREQVCYKTRITTYKNLIMGI